MEKQSPGERRKESKRKNEQGRKDSGMRFRGAGIKKNQRRIPRTPGEGKRANKKKPWGGIED